jgi:hypothetical protein
LKSEDQAQMLIVGEHVYLDNPFTDHLKLRHNFLKHVCKHTYRSENVKIRVGFPHYNFLNKGNYRTELHKLQLILSLN